MPGALDADFCMDFNMSSLQRDKDKATKRLQFQCLKARSLRSKRHPSFDILIFGVQIQSATTCSMLFHAVSFCWVLGADFDVFMSIWPFRSILFKSCGGVLMNDSNIFDRKK